MKKVLIIDDDRDTCLLLSKLLDKNGYRAHYELTGSDGIRWLKKQEVDLLLLDYQLPDTNGLEVMRKIHHLHLEIKVIIITGQPQVRAAVSTLKNGAIDYVSKPLQQDVVLKTIDAIFDKKPRNNSHKIRKKKTERFIVGNSPQFRTIHKHIQLIAPTDMSVVLVGETGTGKEFVAREIHNESKRQGRPFVAVDCGALPENLVGSELFGHVKGAFTGAVSNKKGCFELADKGTLFLDEIGNLSYGDQIQLLRVLQDGIVKRVGSIQDIKVDVRLITATNEDLKKLVDTGSFRRDIYHRINEFKISLPPLRERPEDIELFAWEFVKNANDELGRKVQGVSDQALEALKKYSWNGNLRELRNVIKRAVLVCRDDLLTTQSLPHEILGLHSSGNKREDLRADNRKSSTKIRGLKKVAEDAEKRAIIRTLQRTDNNKTKSADILGVDRKTLYNKMNAYNIEL